MTVEQIEWEESGLRLRLMCVQERTWRLQSTVGDAFDDMGAAQTLARDLGEPYADARLSFEASQVALELSPFALTIGGARITGIRCEDGILSVGGALSEDEALFGCGQQFNTANQRGKRVEVPALAAPDKKHQEEVRT